MLSGRYSYCLRLESDDTVVNFAGEIAEAVGWRTLDFLTALNDTIHTTCPRIIREKGGPRPPEVTLEKEKARVAIWRFSSSKHRAFGIAARFVSGYQKYEPSARRHMHAWPEVYYPEADGAAMTRRMALP